MFVRVKKRNNTDKVAVQIVESIRVMGKPRQKVIQTIGYAFDDKTINDLINVAEHLKQRILNEKQINLFSPEISAEQIIKHKLDHDKINRNFNINIKNLLEDGSYISGFNDVYSKIYEIIGYNSLFSKRYFASAKVFFQIVLARLAKTLSKRASVTFIHDNFNLTDFNISLDKVYRMMDNLADKLINKLQLITYNSINSLFKGKIKVAFYDCSTLYFESFKDDELKSNGYSKDGKFNQPQVLLALLVTQEGLPLGYEVFPGNTFEGKTLEVALNRLKEKYDINDIVVVADSGLMSKENLIKLEERGFSYVLGARLRNLNKQDQSNILDNMHKLTDYSENEKIFELPHDKLRLIVKYSSKRAKKDEYDRLKGIEKIEKKLKQSKNPLSFISNYGYKKYIKYENKGGKIELNEEKLKEESSWDGISGVLTNDKNLSKEEVISSYKGLWQIEDCFRVQKHDLKIRPIYHWTPKRIKAHLAISYAAFSCQQYLKYRLKLQGHKYSSKEITNCLSKVRSSIVYDKSDTKKRFILPSKMDSKAIDIYKTLRISTDRTPYSI